jgi:hypothetical protein
MRFREFKTPLFEFAPPKSVSVDLVGRLETILKSTDETSPEHLEAIKLLQDIIVSAKEESTPQPAPMQPQPPQQAAPPQAATQPVESVATQEQLPLAESNASVSKLINQASKSQANLSSATKQELLARIFELEAAIANAEEEKIKYGQSQYKKGQKKEFATNKAAFEKIATLAEELAYKVSGTLNAMKKAYDEQMARGDFNKKEMQSTDVAPIRPAVKAPTTAAKQELINLIQDMFSRPLGSAETIADRNAKLRNLSNFMSRCIIGIVDFEELLSSKRGNVLDTLDEEAQEIIKIIGNLLLIKPSATAGNWGPGELGLAILGTPVHKGGKGDLQVNGRDIELKASQNPEKGGRLGTVALARGVDGYDKYKSALVELFNNAGYAKNELDYSLKKKEEVTEARAKAVKEPKKSVLPSNNVGVYLDAKGNEKDIKWTSFGRTFVVNALNPKIQDRVGKVTTQKFLAAVATSCLLSKFEKKAGGYDTSFVNDCVNGDGTIDYDAFASGYAKMLYDIYQTVDGKGEIMVLNPLTGSYYVMLDSSEFDEATTAGGDYQPIRIGSVAIDFTDSQGKASPQIGIA